jgi:hypothetical protein
MCLWAIYICNANRLTTAFTDLGKKVETISGGGWRVTTDSVDTLLPILRAKLDLLDPAEPFILWCMDSNFFRQLTASGDLAGITRGEDGRFHITGKLMVTHYSLLRDMLAEINRIVDASSDDSGSSSPLSHSLMLHGPATLCQHQGSGSGLC